jgi:hypothetical protein
MITVVILWLSLALMRRSPFLDSVIASSSARLKSINYGKIEKTSSHPYCQINFVGPADFRAILELGPLSLPV